MEQIRDISTKLRVNTKWKSAKLGDTLITKGRPFLSQILSKIKHGNL